MTGPAPEPLTASDILSLSTRLVLSNLFRLVVIAAIIDVPWQFCEVVRNVAPYAPFAQAGYGLLSFFGAPVVTAALAAFVSARIVGRSMTIGAAFARARDCAPAIISATVYFALGVWILLLVGAIVGVGLLQAIHGSRVANATPFAGPPLLPHRDEQTFTLVLIVLSPLILAAMIANALYNLTIIHITAAGTSRRDAWQAVKTLFLAKSHRLRLVAITLLVSAAGLATYTYFPRQPYLWTLPLAAHVLVLSAFAIGKDISITTFLVAVWHQATTNAGKRASLVSESVDGKVSNWTVGVVLLLLLGIVASVGTWQTMHKPAPPAALFPTARSPRYVCSPAPASEQERPTWLQRCIATVSGIATPGREKIVSFRLTDCSVSQFMAYRMPSNAALTQIETYDLGNVREIHTQSNKAGASAITLTMKAGSVSVFTPNGTVKRVAPFTRSAEVTIPINIRDGLGQVYSILLTEISRCNGVAVPPWAAKNV